MPRDEHIAFTVTFTEKEYYIMRKILNATNEKPEDYIHDCVVALFDTDIDLNFGIDSEAYKELHRLNESDEPLVT